jgi:alkylation response protein AidB-like acyl-CoA dehydrogenase
MRRRIEFRPTTLGAEQEDLRTDVRNFLREELAGAARPALGPGDLADFEFSRALGRRGWLGMALPSEYGGSDRKAVDRFVVVEELLAAGAPVAAHWTADRQTAGMFLRFGTEDQRREFLPSICTGELSFAIGLSEPESGSDLASVMTTASPTENGWLLNGTKVWTSGAHRSQYILVLCRTSPEDDDRHGGLSQLIVPLDAEGVQVNPIHFLDDSHDLNEVVFEDVFVPDDMVLGEVGQGWGQVTMELVLERSGPDRFLSTFPLLACLLREQPDVGADAEKIGWLFARYWTLRQMSLSIAAAVDRGETPSVEAAIVKDLGTKFEQEVVEVVRELADVQPSMDSESQLAELLARALCHAPTFTIRGGTSEILRSVAAKGL